MISMVDDVSNWSCDGFWQVPIDKNGYLEREET